jgi:antagonist of KipI
VQDVGRPGYAHLGISASGAADALSLRAGNLLVGNPEGAAALEMTLSGGTFEFESGVAVALTGADFEAGIPMWQTVEIKPGEMVRCGLARTGARCYLCLAGGIDVPPVLGSSSTHLITRLGGLEGRALKRGDVLRVRSGSYRRRRRGISSGPPPYPALRITRGPQSKWFDFNALLHAQWQVREDSDRMGLRLRGPAMARHAGHMLTEGVPLGALQIPPDGQPIILFVEHQTTGGYPKVANVISSDFHALGQLRPRDLLSLEHVSIDTALSLLRQQEEWLHSLLTIP